MNDTAAHPDSGHDIAGDLCAQVAEAHRSSRPLRIAGGGTKSFYGRAVNGTALDVTGHCGITHYDPVELVVSARAGTRLTDLESALAAAGQQLAFEPPRFGMAATVGGMVATGLSGPRRPWSGAVRDFVLGTRLITHEGKQLRFGGEVMKNVAGYDVSRLVTGAQGTLGVITEVSLKVLPLPAATHSLGLPLPLESAFAKLAKWGRQPVPLTGAAWHDGTLYLRLEGGARSVDANRARLGGQSVKGTFWEQLRELELPFFSSEDPRPLWRISVPQVAPPLELDGDWLYDWAGGQRWLRSGAEAEHIRETAVRAGGHATCFTQDVAEPFTPLTPVLAKYHRQLKSRLDPNGIFNPGRLYPDL